jgi:hypothetical protein
MDKCPKCGCTSTTGTGNYWRVCDSCRHEWQTSKPKTNDLGNTRINGTSDGLARGSKLTGRINRAVSIGEEALRQHGSAFDSHLRNADSPKCAGCGTALTGRADVWDSYGTGKDWCKECDGTKARESVMKNAGDRRFEEGPHPRAIGGPNACPECGVDDLRIKKHRPGCSLLDKCPGTDHPHRYEDGECVYCGKKGAYKNASGDAAEEEAAHSAWSKKTYEQREKWLVLVGRGDAAKELSTRAWSQLGPGLRGSLAWAFADGAVENAAEKRNDHAKRVCAWCKKDMGQTESDAYAKGVETHGVCPDCAKKIEQQNAGDDGFLRQSGMGLAPAPEPGDALEEPQPLMANARQKAAVERGAAKYGKS